MDENYQVYLSVWHLNQYKRELLGLGGGIHSTVCHSSFYSKSLQPLHQTP